MNRRVDQDAAAGGVDGRGAVDINPPRAPGGPDVDTDSGDTMDQGLEGGNEGDDSGDDDISTTWDEANLRRFDDGTTLTEQCGSSRVGGTKDRWRNWRGRRDTAGTRSTSRFFLLKNHYYVKIVTIARFLALRTYESPFARPRRWRERGSIDLNVCEEKWMSARCSISRW